MKTILFCALLVFSSFAQAKDVVAKSVAVQYEQAEYYGDAFISFTVTIAASDFSDIRFGQMAAFVVDTNDEANQIAPAQLIYGKDPEWVIVDSEVFSFQYRGQEALDVIQGLKSSRILFRNDIGSDDLAIDIAGLCKTQPASFSNLAGGSSGCP